MTLKTSQTNPQSLAHPAALILSLPLRFKITIPYLIVAILWAGLASWVITQSFVSRLQERFDVQLVDGFQTASTAVYQAESNALITERAIARTAGVAEAVTAQDSDKLNTLIRPLAVNAHTPLVHILDETGKLIYGLRLTQQGAMRDEYADFTEWDPVRRVLAGESDHLGDKFSGVMEGPVGPALYVAGPIILDGKRVGVALVGFPLNTLLPQMVADSTAQITLYRPDGRAAFSTFSQGLQMPALTPDTLALVNAEGVHPLQSRFWTLKRAEFHEAIGPLVVRGRPSEWALAVALPRSLITSSARVSPVQLVVVFTLAVLAVIGLGLLVAKIISIPVFELVDASTRVAKGDLEATVREHAQDELGLLSRQFNHMVEQLRQREFMHGLFGRMVSEEVRESLLLEKQQQLGGELKVVSVLFTDIRQFTTFSEYHSPQEVVGMLNGYFGIVNSAIREAGGMLNKFAGDSTMAIFGAPVGLEPGETARRALRAAFLIHIRIMEFNAHRVRAGLEPINIGIGINTGEAITGNVGAEDRFEYTVIGDVVNVASRLQGFSSQFTESNILMSAETYNALPEKECMLVVDHGSVTFKGRSHPVHVYNLISVRSGNILPTTQTENPSPVHLRDALETAYLYCRGFDPATIALTKNLPLDTVQRWIEEAASNFEQTRQELSLEFNLTATELQVLYEAKPGGAPLTQQLNEGVEAS